MGAQVGGGRGRQPIVGINITPMVDVVLVLLIIMMVSANYVVRQSLKVELPASASSDGPASSPMVVAIGPKGELSWNGQPVAEDALQRELAAAAKRTPEGSLVVSGDKAASHGTIVHVMDLARRAGLRKFAVGIDKEAR
jgi:biopolymer transport protein ExbD